MLTGKQKRFLRKEAHHLSPIFQVGKQGVNENMIAQLNDVLEKRELIKVNILQNVFEDKKEIAQQIVQGTESELVQLIGNIVILYKPSEENKQIQLP
ncbi:MULTISPECIES: ribosome assembly RNA-binding protein YhbY [Allobacillus]|uniref:Ribosome assembly RNA-binding protein YhbY n=1 Tax=Allobacillus salarius TaxID=1955272 RepID=A0A556PTR1_9BACI|nr:ribosome assembly RNA-binding protein YhbY [Allobacillus salarius]TSJ67774.1 ribosome assembly RNA-binding protein YhbY [Allobacillus salarius]